MGKLLKIENVTDSTIKLHLAEDLEVGWDRPGLKLHDNAPEDVLPSHIREVAAKYLDKDSEFFSEDLARATAEGGPLKVLGESATDVAVAGSDGVVGTADDKPAVGKQQTDDAPPVPQNEAPSVLPQVGTDDAPAKTVAAPAPEKEEVKEDAGKDKPQGPPAAPQGGPVAKPEGAPAAKPKADKQGAKAEKETDK